MSTMPSEEFREKAIALVGSLSRDQLERLFALIEQGDESDIDWLLNCIAGRVSELQ